MVNVFMFMFDCFVSCFILVTATILHDMMTYTYLKCLLYILIYCWLIFHLFKYRKVVTILYMSKAVRIKSLPPSKTDPTHKLQNYVVGIDNQTLLFNTHNCKKRRCRY